MLRKVQQGKRVEERGQSWAVMKARRGSWGGVQYQQCGDRQMELNPASHQIEHPHRRTQGNLNKGRAVISAHYPAGTIRLESSKVSPLGRPRQ